MIKPHCRMIASPRTRCMNVAAEKQHSGTDRSCAQSTCVTAGIELLSTRVRDEGGDFNQPSSCKVCCRCEAVCAECLRICTVTQQATRDSAAAAYVQCGQSLLISLVEVGMRLSEKCHNCELVTNSRLVHSCPSLCRPHVSTSGSTIACGDNGDAIARSDLWRSDPPRRESLV